jgi:hypothetical protein
MTQITAYSPQRLYKYIKYLQTICVMLSPQPSFYLQQQTGLGWNGQ